MTLRRPSIVLAAALLLAGCGGSEVPLPSQSPSGGPSVEPSVEASVGLPLDPGVLGLTCGEGLVFHPSRLEGAGRAEADPDDAAAALRQVLAEPRDPNEFPPDGWHRVGQTGDRAQFVARGLNLPWVVVALTRRNGRWEPDQYGACNLEVVLPPGVTRAEWRLDPAFPSPAPGDRVIHVLINERACTGGQSPEGRVRAPIVASSPTAMTIAILVTDLPGGHDCPGNPDFPMAVELPAPLGGRPLLDGAVFPPRDVTQPAG